MLLFVGSSLTSRIRSHLHYRYWWTQVILKKLLMKDKIN